MISKLTAAAFVVVLLRCGHSFAFEEGDKPLVAKVLEASIRNTIKKTFEDSPSVYRSVSRYLFECTTILEVFNKAHTVPSAGESVRVTLDAAQIAAIRLSPDSPAATKKMTEDAFADAENIVNRQDDFASMLATCKDFFDPNRVERGVSVAVAYSFAENNGKDPHNQKASPKVGSATRDGRKFIYREKVEAYWNDWSGLKVGGEDGDQPSVHIRGEGKTADFEGVLSLNCSSGSGYLWKTASNFSKNLNEAAITEIVPLDVLAGAKKLFCKEAR
jgi:hypothetical protein